MVSAQDSVSCCAFSISSLSEENNSEVVSTRKLERKRSEHDKSSRYVYEHTISLLSIIVAALILLSSFFNLFFKVLKFNNSLTPVLYLFLFCNQGLKITKVRRYLPFILAW